MRIGYGLPVAGPAAGPEALAQVASRAEDLGFDSLWVWERVIFPVEPQVPYVASADGSYPEAFKRVLDPLDTLTFVAAHTKRVALGTSVLDMPYYNPVLLARRITTIDILSGGRVRLGLGLGWCKDEFDVVGRPMKRLGRLADEFISVLKNVWTNDPAEHHGEFYELPKSIMQAKPVQKPHPPIYLAAYSPGGLNRAARTASGWTPVGIPVDGMREMYQGLRSMAQEAGRSPDEVELIVRANFTVTDQPLGNGRYIFYGSLDEIKSDVEAVREMGAAEIFFDPSFSPDGASAEGFLARMEQIRELA
jgi:probable F420-dependent oxidoreductase